MNEKETPSILKPLLAGVNYFSDINNISYMALYYGLGHATQTKTKNKQHGLTRRTFNILKSELTSLGKHFPEFPYE